MLKKLLHFILVSQLIFAANAIAQEIPNRLIDYDAFVSQVPEVGQLRQNRRLTEDEFIRTAKEKDVIIFDARSKERYDKLHIKGSKNLSLPDITAEGLAQVIPDKSTKILNLLQQ